MQNIDIELVLKVLVGVAGIIVSLFQLRNLKPISRSAIKTDLEMLKMLDESDPNHAMIKARFDETIRRVYSMDHSTGTKVHSWRDFIFGVTFLSVFSVWTILLLKNGFTPWSLLTGFFAVAGLGGIMNGFDPKRAKQK
ncbi:MAG: hypothetical protein HYR76_05580 [Ignavibacteria bacterium]|nr:hypothetical protein [Ignavibacteria bacterium]